MNNITQIEAPVEDEDAEDHWAFQMPVPNHIQINPNPLVPANEGISDLTSVASGSSFNMPQLEINQAMNEDLFVPIFPEPIVPGGIGLLNIQLAYGQEDLEDPMHL